MKMHIGAALFFLLAASMLAFGRHEETTEQLIARAEAAPGQQQSDLFLEVAERQLKSAIEAFKAGKNDDGRAALQQIVAYGDKARSAALGSSKHLKHTEIKLRQISKRLRDVKLNIDVDDQGGVQSAIDKLEQFRTELLKNMFGAKKND